MEQKTVFEILTDENDVENVVLCDEDGTETEFEQEVTLTLDDEIYCILCPLDAEGIVSDEGFVFKLSEQNHDSLQLVSDEQIIDRVFAEYEKLCQED